MSEMTGETSIRYEHKVPEDTLVGLHQLCEACTRFRDECHMLSDFHQRKSLRHGTEETYYLGSVNELKSGYLAGCHLCALLWQRGGGSMMDPSKPTISGHEIVIYLRARNQSVDGREAGLWSLIQTKWWSILPPLIGELGVIDMWLTAVRPHDQSALRQMYIYLSSSPNVNQLSLKDTPEPLSSKHEMKFSYIQSRYRECTKKHKKCVDFHRLIAPTQQLPSRLLDLQGDMVKLRCDIKDDDQLEYTTLSHMWGPDPSVCLQLKMGVLDDFKAQIPEQSLPTKYLEAIRITKALGFRYIWIDSLCIIQDSNDDWKKEARKMSAVYGRTSCNISYVYPPSNSPSMHHLRDPRVSLPCRLSPNPSPLQVRARPSLVVQHIQPPLRRGWSSNVYKIAWPLLSRAWVFQERLLCPRNIYYGANLLYWECCEAIEDEFYGPVFLSEGSKAELYSVFAGGNQSENHLSTLIAQWFSLVQTYRLGSLTYEKDRAMAFAGVARAIQLQTNYLYLAGIWREFVELGLLWHIEPPWNQANAHFDEFRRRREQIQVAAPSWSWFSVPTIPDAKVAQVDAVGFRICSSFLGRSSCAIYKARIDSFDHPNLASDPDSLLYDFTGLSITLRAPITPCTMLWDKDVLRVLPWGRYMLGDAGWQDDREAMDYCHDDFTLNPGSEPPTGACMILTILCAYTVQGGKEIRYDEKASRRMGVSPGWQYAGLVVVPSSKKGCWRRVGVFVFTTRPRDQIKEMEVPFNWEDGEEDIVLV